jgi:hypothetical protein
MATGNGGGTDSMLHRRGGRACAISTGKGQGMVNGEYPNRVNRFSLQLISRECA